MTVRRLAAIVPAIRDKAIRVRGIKARTVDRVMDRVIIHISVVNIKVMVVNMEEIHMRAMNVEQAICAAIFGVRIHFVNAWEEICVHVSKVWQG